MKMNAFTCHKAKKLQAGCYCKLVLVADHMRDFFLYNFDLFLHVSSTYQWKRMEGVSISIGAPQALQQWPACVSCTRVSRAPCKSLLVTLSLGAPALALSVSAHRCEAHLRPRICSEVCNSQIPSAVHRNGICKASSKGWLSLILHWGCAAKGGMEDKPCSFSQEIMSWLTAFNQSSALLKVEKAPLCQGDGIISPGTYLILLLGPLVFVSNC